MVSNRHLGESANAAGRPRAARIDKLAGETIQAAFFSR